MPLAPYTGKPLSNNSVEDIVWGWYISAILDRDTSSPNKFFKQCSLIPLIKDLIS